MMRSMNAALLVAVVALGQAGCGRGAPPGPAVAAVPPERDRIAPPRGGPAPRPGREEISATEQSAWIDENLPKLLAGMAASPDVRSKIAGSLPLRDARSSAPLMPGAGGLAPGDLERAASLVQGAVASRSRYRRSAEAEPRPTVAAMPRSRIVRVEMAYPAPPASKELEPGPLTIDIWACPDRETALALFWLRRRGIDSLEPGTPDGLARSVAGAPDFAEAREAEEGLGESSYWLMPGLEHSLPRTKAEMPIPADRLSFLRDNVVAEASTLEFVWDEGRGRWVANFLHHGAPDVIAIMRAIDAGLANREGPRGSEPE